MRKEGDMFIYNKHISSILKNLAAKNIRTFFKVRWHPQDPTATHEFIIAILFFPAFKSFFSKSLKIVLRQKKINRRIYIK